MQLLLFSSVKSPWWHFQCAHYRATCQLTVIISLVKQNEYIKHIARKKFVMNNLIWRWYSRDDWMEGVYCWFWVSIIQCYVLQIFFPFFWVEVQGVNTQQSYQYHNSYFFLNIRLCTGVGSLLKMILVANFVDCSILFFLSENKMKLMINESTLKTLIEPTMAPSEVWKLA